MREPDALAASSISGIGEVLMKRIVLTPDEMRAIEFDWKCSTEKYRRHVEGTYNQHDSTVKLRRLRFPLQILNEPSILGISFWPLHESILVGSPPHSQLRNSQRLHKRIGPSASGSRADLFVIRLQVRPNLHQSHRLRSICRNA